MRRLSELSENQKDHVALICWLLFIAFLLNLYPPNEWIEMYHGAKAFMNYARY